MRPYRSLEADRHVDELVERLGRLQPTTARRWGRMTPHQMLCHVADAFLAVLGERDVSKADTWWSRSVIKWIALHTSLPWPHGIQTVPEVDPNQCGTQPAEFARDRARVVELLRRFVRPDTHYGRHPIFAEMSRREWLLWGYAHVDHHLRQFGV
jgi:hypothetical protein